MFRPAHFGKAKHKYFDIYKVPKSPTGSNKHMDLFLSEPIGSEKPSEA